MLIGRMAAFSLLLFLAGLAVFGADRKETRLPVIGATSSTVLEPGWDPKQVIDGWYKAPWFSSSKCLPDRPEWLQLELAGRREISRILLWPRYSGRNRKPLGLSFPQSFVLQVSLDGKSWRDLAGTAVGDYPVPKGWGRAEFVLRAPVRGKFVRLFVTECGADDGGNRFLQLAEFELFGPGATGAVKSPPLPETVLVRSLFPEVARLRADASSIIWSPRALIDGWNDNPWFSTRAAPDGQPEWASIEFEGAAKIRQLLLVPRVLPFEGRPVSVGFPIDFEFQSSLDGQDWESIPGLQFKNYARPSVVTGETFTIRQPLKARFVRVRATRFGSDDPSGEQRIGRYLQLAEFWVFGNSE